MNRMIGAAATNGAWGSSYTYDGFGNLTGKTPTAGSAPYFSALIDPTTNRQFGQQYDANGNPAVNGAFPYDIENRLQPAPAPFATFTYDHAGKRIFASPQVGGNYAYTPCEIYFYGIAGQRLATFTCSYYWSYSQYYQAILPQYVGYQVKSWNVYFGSKLMRSAGKTIVTDRLGSVRANSGGERMQYFPYGEERTSTPDGREKWATYFRDGLGQDYADQRYYSPLSGSFWTPDAGGLATADSSDPTSWNRFAYVQGDPVNFRDPSGRYAIMTGDGDCGPDWMWDASLSGPCPGGGYGDSSGGGGGGGGYCGGTYFSPFPSPFCYFIPFYSPPPPPPPPSCSLSVVASGPPRDGQNVVGRSSYSPFTNTLGPYTNQGWFDQVQIQINLFGDTNPNDWTIGQSASVSGSRTIQLVNGRINSGPYSASEPNDSPDPSLVFRGTGRIDWLDNPGESVLVDRNRDRLVAASETFSFTSFAWDGVASCSRNWSLSFTLNRNGMWSMMIR
ncbi:hypothetical protein SBA4_2340002 [Candidatus Sulfopaludibacter sp. SbA4]|nr:hypothetical protein SBA4_2340002 [Candidatus Sulfopaludibacter sp. SbA4]